MTNATATCRVCGAAARLLFVTKILRKYDVSYFECPACRFVQTEEPFWLSEAYASSINAEDTGLLVRNAAFAERLSVLLFSLVGPQGKFLDYAGGYGVFTRMMRDRGFDFRWSDKFTQNLFAQGFEYRPDETVDALTVFEAFEHFAHPVTELENLLSIADIVVFSTELMPEQTPAAGTWWYYGHQHGQHIAFYRQQTLAALADRFGLRWYSNRQNLHLFTRRELAPYCFPERKFGILNRQSDGRLTDFYLRTEDRARKRRTKIRLYLDAVRGRTYRTAADGLAASQFEAITRLLQDSSVFNDYVQYLLSGDLRSWAKLLRSRLESKTFADMERVIEMQASRS